MPQTSRGYPYPTLSDPPNTSLHLQQLAQAVDADVQAVDTRLSAAVAVTTITGATPASGFTIDSCTVRVLGGALAVLSLVFTNQGAITATGGNISDTAVCTIPPGGRPTEPINAIFGDGTTDGEANIGPNGVVTLRTSVGSMPAGRISRLTATYFLV